VGARPCTHLHQVASRIYPRVQCTVHFSAPNSKVRFVQSLLRSTSRRRSWERLGSRMRGGDWLCGPGRVPGWPFRISETGQGGPVEVVPAAAWRPCIPAPPSCAVSCPPCQLQSRVETARRRSASTAGTLQVQLARKTSNKSDSGTCCICTLDVRNGGRSWSCQTTPTAVCFTLALHPHFFVLAMPARPVPASMANSQPRASSTASPGRGSQPSTSRAAFIPTPRLVRIVRSSRHPKGLRGPARICPRTSKAHVWSGALSSSIDACGCFQRRDGLDALSTHKRTNPDDLERLRFLQRGGAKRFFQSFRRNPNDLDLSSASLLCDNCSLGFALHVLSTSDLRRSHPS